MDGKVVRKSQLNKLIIAKSIFAIEDVISGFA